MNWRGRVFRNWVDMKRDMDKVSVRVDYEMEIGRLD